MTDDSAANKDVVSRFYNDVFIGHDMSRLDEYMRDDYIQHNPDCSQASPEQRINRQMRGLGYEPSDVKYVILSHLHLDHMGCMTLFPNATCVVRRQELRAAWWPDAYEGGYNFESLLGTRGLKYLQPFGEDEFDVFQDGSLICIDTKGHTEGHQSMIVTLPGAGRWYWQVTRPRSSRA
jgi:glyoxylase-like metal-dependent hydrolase (beta-lactamase superfamily II)